MKKMEITVITILVGLLFGALTYSILITSCYKTVCDKVEFLYDDLAVLEEDKKLLLDDKLDCCRENEKLRSDNVILSETVRELRKINKELMNMSPAEVSLDPQKERLPEGVATNRYDCEGFKFPVGTAQYKLQQFCTNDWETGIRIFTRDNIRYRCVAMGTAYGIDIGDAWEVTLNNGYSFPIVLADYQHDITVIDPDDFGERFAYDDNGDIIDVLRNYDGEECVHVLEFIADLDAIPQAAKEAGGMHGLTIFGGKFGDGGNIAKLKYLGRVWEP